ncbi:uncharacterized protein THITE_123400 [Thermothielavioides terrestris NRRL 8126]|uniref:Rhodopsin domain-containing protein n=1 Tax=Thermothielavioides terrestris (strain ATCC 38088 / NRRL 8126) TaxID=578455 RepID=G2QWF3_THETT|nr:uncharacterized protein THITE_123400 [Thermothielavioides terrestris NRRL 8126]AEO63928.1 hypothetical protein THITE_123400 [Thermothielavioides terrestris NRRL 8126]
MLQLIPQGLSVLLARQAENGAAATALPPQSLDLSSYPTTGLQQFALFLIIFFPAVSLVLVGLRVYDRATTKTFGIDDGFIVAATILAVAEAVFSYAMVKLQYLGLHVWQLPTTPYDPTASLVVNYIVVMLYNPELGLVKSSVLFFLLRLGGHQRFLRRLIHALNWSNIALLIAVLFASIFTCVPINKYWTPSLPGHCNNESLQYLITSGLTVLTDVLVLAIPVKIVVGLQIAKKLKVILICLLCSGIIVTVFSILRMRALYRLYYPPADPGPDPTYDISFVYSTIECNLAIITATIPPLHGLMRKWFPRFFRGASGNSSNRYRQGYTGASGALNTIGGGAMALKDLTSPTRSQRARQSRLNSLSNSEEDILEKPLQ